MIKINQHYMCAGDHLYVQFTFNDFGLITHIDELNEYDYFNSHEINLPKIEVTPYYFNLIQNKVCVF